MPLSATPPARWPSTGPAARDAVVFDVSHLGTVRVAGADALDRLQAALTNDLGKIGPGRAQYTHLLDDATPRCSTTSSCGGSTTSAST